MTHRVNERIRRLADGSIDYRHYDQRARRIRSAEFQGLAGLLQALDPRKR
jgi:hypothetical protein